MSKTKNSLLSSIESWKQQSENLRSQYDSRWAKNLKLTKGIFSDGETSVSNVRKNKNKIFFRKIWATIWRLVASLYATFLRDPNVFLVQGRDPINDGVKAAALQSCLEFRVDEMNRTDSLFKKHIWAFMNICTFGWTVGKLSWKYDEELGVDGPAYMLYPNEQVFPDFAAETKEDMAYIIFENYLTMDQLKAQGYKNLDDIEKNYIPFNQLRAVRNQNTTDPLQNPKDTEYPKPGSVEDNNKSDMVGARYRTWECFYKKDGEVYYCVTQEGNAVLKDPIRSPYGNGYSNIIMGDCLTEPHKLVGEGFPEPLEGPQESYNYNINMRKDNIALSMNRQMIVSRYGNVDLQSLTNRRPGGVTLADDVNAVRVEDYPDVTRSSYTEAQADDNMMQEMSGVNQQLNGMSSADSATEAQINLGQGAAKIELYIAIVGETYMKDFYASLAKMIQKFETDETVMRVANTTLRSKGYIGEDLFDLDFHANIVINAGLNAGREAQVRNVLLAMDRAIMANQSATQILTSGAAPKNGVRMVDTSALFEDILPLLGKRDVGKYIFTVGPPPAPPQTVSQQISGGDGGAMAGKIQPQIGGMGGMPPQNQFQAGGLGGVF